MPLSERRRTRIETVASQRQAGFVVVLEDIHDPHNAAAILRTCDAFGIQTVAFIFDREPRYNPRRVGKTSSSSANQWLDFGIYPSTAQCYAALRRNKFQIVATALTEQTTNLYMTDLTSDRIALVVGNEHRGLSDVAIQQADRAITIPMSGFVQSLNVSVMAALAIAEITRQRQGRGGQHLYGKNSARDLVNQWVEFGRGRS